MEKIEIDKLHRKLQDTDCYDEFIRWESVFKMPISDYISSKGHNNVESMTWYFKFSIGDIFTEVESTNLLTAIISLYQFILDRKDKILAFYYDELKNHVQKLRKRMNED